MRSASDLRNKIGLLRVGDVAELAVLRAGKSIVIRATVATAVEKSTQGGQINPLLEGATFGSVTADTSVKGVEVISVQTGSKAARAGLRKGDIITSANQEEIAGPEEFAALKRDEVRLNRFGIPKSAYF